MYGYIATFDESSPLDMQDSHPADIVPHFLANPNRDSANLRMDHLESWYREWVQVRKQNTFKTCGSCVPS